MNKKIEGFHYSTKKKRGGGEGGGWTGAMSRPKVLTLELHVTV